MGLGMYDGACDVAFCRRRAYEMSVTICKRLVEEGQFFSAATASATVTFAASTKAAAFAAASEAAAGAARSWSSPQVKDHGSCGVCSAY